MEMLMIYKRGNANVYMCIDALSLKYIFFCFVLLCCQYKHAQAQCFVHSSKMSSENSQDNEDFNATFYMLFITVSYGGELTNVVPGIFCNFIHQNLVTMQLALPQQVAYTVVNKYSYIHNYVGNVV